MAEHPIHGRKAPERTDPAPVPQFVTRAPRFRLESDLILAANTRLQLDESLAKLRYHRMIYDEWKFSSVDPLGSGTVLNFYGPPGTGKTMAGEAFAGTLGSALIHIGIAELESKFMGETAKNIQRAFEAAANANAVLFFDEADTLLGKRLSSVTQGIDHEVNSMRSTMLIELERFVGIAIFATNFAQNYDEAFRSRITHHVRFSLPDALARRQLWNRMLLPTIPLDGDRDSLIAKCVELSEGLSGRDIRTCMRLSLPKPLLASETSGAAVALTIHHLEEAIAQVRTAQTDVGSPIVSNTHAQAAVARSLLGIHENRNEV